MVYYCSECSNFLAEDFNCILFPKDKEIPNNIIEGAFPCPYLNKDLDRLSVMEGLDIKKEAERIKGEAGEPIKSEEVY